MSGVAYGASVTPKVAAGGAGIVEAELSELLARLPRVRLVRTPTPLEPAPRLSERLGVEVWFKRDDLTGGALSGNKGRALEYVLGDALEQKADCVLVGGPIESNYPRALAAAAAKCGLEAFLVLRGDRRRCDTGNAFLARLLGARVHFTDARDRPGNEAAKDTLAAQLASEGRRPYVIRGDFAASPQAVLATIASVATALELAGQLKAMQLAPQAMFVASTGPTWAGLSLGIDLLGAAICVHGVGYADPKPAATSYAQWLTTMACERLGVPPPPRGDHPFHDEFIGYGKITAATRDALLVVARTAGVLLDPLYGAKAMASLRRAVDDWSIPRGARVIFVHTGGVPALFDPSLSGELLDDRG